MFQTTNQIWSIFLVQECHKPSQEVITSSLVGCQCSPFPGSHGCHKWHSYTHNEPRFQDSSIGLYIIIPTYILVDIIIPSNSHIIPHIISHNPTNNDTMFHHRHGHGQGPGLRAFGPSIDAVRLSVEELDGDQRKAHTPGHIRHAVPKGGRIS